MPASTNLMEMPQEILVMILRAYFGGVEVNLIHPDSRCWDAKKWQHTGERPSATAADIPLAHAYQQGIAFYLV